MIKYECDKCGKEETASGSVYEVQIRGGLSFEICIDCKRELEAFMETKPEQKVLCQRCLGEVPGDVVDGGWYERLRPKITVGYTRLCSVCIPHMACDTTSRPTPATVMAERKGKAQ